MKRKKDDIHATYKELAEYLGVSEAAVKQYPPLKRELMQIGLRVKKAISEKSLHSQENQSQQ